MEKRRRARINESLGQLKTLILDALKKDVSITAHTFSRPHVISSVSRNDGIEIPCTDHFSAVFTHRAPDTPSWRKRIFWR